MSIAIQSQNTLKFTKKLSNLKPSLNSWINVPKVALKEEKVMLQGVLFFVYSYVCSKYAKHKKNKEIPNKYKINKKRWFKNNRRNCEKSTNVIFVGNTAIVLWTNRKNLEHP